MTRIRLRRLLMALVFANLVVALAWVGEWGVAPLPGIMPKLYPFQGIWRQQAQKQLHRRISSTALAGVVEVTYDPQGVPHIFAEQTADLFWVQGYLTAKDRLWQMDFQSRIAEGRLSELMGDRTRHLDEFFVTIGMRETIERTDQLVRSDPLTRLAAERYVEGVNAFIRSLGPHDFPIEYFLTGTRPRRWTTRELASLLKFMSYRLAGRSSDLQLTHHLKRFGRSRIEDLFPDELPLESPFIPPGRWGQKPTSGLKAPPDFFITALNNMPRTIRPARANGSNNWAVAGEKTRSGFPLLSNDTHLGYTLPAIWYEVQLHAPDFKVYGATIPGAPGVILGYNNKVAWGVTNATLDVMDWYEIEFRDEQSSEFLVEGKWQTGTTTQEIITVRGQPSIEKNLLWTHVGPVVYREGKLGLALKWVAHESTNELQALLKLNQAQSFNECAQALESYQVPAQNFICADAKNIGIWHNGRIPSRWKGQGRYVLDGRREDHLWQGFLKREDIPQALNPQQGFVYSANQRPVDSSYPHYLGWDYADPYRGARIREFLSRRERLDWTDMLDLQNDLLNSHAREVLPDMLLLIERKLPKTSEMKAVLDELELWDYRDHEHSVASSIFEEWWSRFEASLWEDEFKTGDDELYPATPRTVQLIKNLRDHPKHNDRQWLDRPQTQQVEDLGDLLAVALQETVHQLREQFGPELKDWKWQFVRPTYLPHVSRFPGLGVEGLEVAGSRYTVNANQGHHGPTWRMIVSFEPEPRGWGNIPGGISGNPFDPDYTRFVKDWSKGKPREFRRYQSASEAVREAQTRWSFRPPEVVQ